MLNPFIKDKVNVTLANLTDLIVKSKKPIAKWSYKECDFKKGTNLPVVDDSWDVFNEGDCLTGKDKHFWLYTEVKTPKASENEEVFFEIITGQEGGWLGTNPQAIIYLNGHIAHGIDINHRKVVLKPDTEYKIHLYFYMGIKCGSAPIRTYINVRDTLVQQLYYDINVPNNAAKCFKETDYAYIKTMKHLDAVCNIIDFSDEYFLKGHSGNSQTTGINFVTIPTEFEYSERFYESAKKAVEYMRTEYFQKACGANGDAVVNYVGHTHIDVAWLWTLAVTQEKAQHSFATVIALMERYPEYIFMSSQPQLYEYVKNEAPELYEKIKEKVREGRWEVDGAMWLEADCNLSSGESLIRQILYGKGFMKEEFGVDSKILWLPDVFGYSAAMPQILMKSGVDKFVTSKISWNETNKMPYDSFMWQGIDGTEIFTYFLTANLHKCGEEPKTTCTYSGNERPEMTLGTWLRYQQKELCEETVVSFGHGDGGGGPTEEMLEGIRRLEHELPGIPKAQMSRVGDFLNRVKEKFDENCKKLNRVTRWVGELYLEFHRGTYTSVAKNKKNNRFCEFLCQETEALSVTDSILLNGEYPRESLFESWKLLLLNQFHDIIPGSSIADVYKDSDEQYDKVRKEIGDINSQKLQALADNVSQKGIMVYNPNSFEASSYVDYNGEKLYAKNVPAMGWKVISPEKSKEEVTVQDHSIENKYYKLIFNDRYEIQSIYDKENQREVLAGNGNVIMSYEDFPRNYDNWEISNYYKDKSETITDVSDVKAVTDGVVGGYEITRKYRKSIIKQRIVMYADSRRIDFETYMDWHENHKVIKALFPVDIHANKATYEIQFGSVERNNHFNTSWDEAQFEVCAQKWIDFSENDYGVSILNDCKYGHYVDGNEMSITLVKCGTYPHHEADQGEHTFTYSLYPHKGDYTQGGIVNEAYILNRPLKAVAAKGCGELPEEYSLISCDKENVIIETVKEAENGNGIIVRLYDAWNKKTNANITLGFDAKKISLCDMLENPIEQIGGGRDFSVNVKNFEIVTLLIER